MIEILSFVRAKMDTKGILVGIHSVFVYGEINYA